MADSSSLSNTPAGGSSKTAAFPVQAILRLEGLAAAALAAVLYGRTGASWWLFATLWLAPDLSMAGYLVGSCWGARVYNAFHSYLTPAALAATALMLHSAGPLPYALIWFNHIGIDRLLGYGLKYPEGFGNTHLGRLGRLAKDRVSG